MIIIRPNFFKQSPDINDGSRGELFPQFEHLFHCKTDPTRKTPILLRAGNAVLETISSTIRSLVEHYQLLPENERVITDVLRQIIKENIPASCKEKISYNVPFFSGNKGLCITWPSTIPGGVLKGNFTWLLVR